MIDVEYCYHKNKYFAFGLEGNYTYYFPYTANRPGYDLIKRDAANSFAFGLFLRINPRIRILDLTTRLDD